MWRSFRSCLICTLLTVLQGKISSSAISVPKCQSPRDRSSLSFQFTLELYRRRPGAVEPEPTDLVRNMTASSANFLVRHVEAGSVYDAHIYAR